MQGIAVFLASNALQLWSHSLLASLAASSGTPKGGTDVYQVPKGVQSFSCQLCAPFKATACESLLLCLAGGPFELVSCPHYLAEILIYLGLALLCGQPQPLTYMALLWVVSDEKGRLHWLQCS